VRVYCWRVGFGVNVTSGEECWGCRSPNHEEYKVDDCGAFDEVNGAPLRGGAHRKLLVGHIGNHYDKP